MPRQLAHSPTACPHPPPTGRCASCCSTRAPAAWRTCSARPSRWRCLALATRGWCRSRRAAQTCPSQVGGLGRGKRGVVGRLGAREARRGGQAWVQSLGQASAANAHRTWLKPSLLLMPPPRPLPPCPAAPEENRREFVELYVDFWLNHSIHSQFEAFAKGFLMLCGGPALQVRRWRWEGHGCWVLPCTIRSQACCTCWPITDPSRPRFPPAAF